MASGFLGALSQIAKPVSAVTRSSATPVWLFYVAI